MGKPYQHKSSSAAHTDLEVALVSVCRRRMATVADRRPVEALLKVLLKAGADPAALGHEDMSVPALKAVLGALGLSKDGRKDVLVTRLEQAHALRATDRRKVYAALTAAGRTLPSIYSDEGHLPHHAVLERDPATNELCAGVTFVENEDWVKVNGVRINKPFVEKPVDAEDHNFTMYYPSTAGGDCGGSRRLDGASGASQFFAMEHRVRTRGSYIYEEVCKDCGDWSGSRWTCVTCGATLCDEHSDWYGSHGYRSASCTVARQGHSCGIGSSWHCRSSSDEEE